MAVRTIPLIEPRGSPRVADKVRSRFEFADWDAGRSEVRWMCAFDTAEADVDAFAALLREQVRA